MFGSVVLDVTIGLVFVFLLYSLLATTVNEIIVASVGLKARFLRKGIERMLNDEYVEKMADGMTLWEKAKVIFRRIKIKISGFFLVENYQYKKSVAGGFYRHPSVFYMAENKYHSKPSYLDASNFSTILVSTLEGNETVKDSEKMAKIEEALKKGSFEIDGDLFTIDPQTLKELKDRHIEAEGDIKKFKASLESWFDTTMERASGWYKRKVRLILFCIGFLIAMLFNVNTLDIVKVLSKDKEARNQMVTLATNATKETAYADRIATVNDTIKPETEEELLARQKVLKTAYDGLIKDSKDASHILAMGWNFDTLKIKYNPKKSELRNSTHSVYKKAKFIVRSTFHPVTNFIGFIITAVALSMGAAFWFDLLKKLVEAKGTMSSGGGKKGDDEEGSTTPKAKS